MPAFRIVFTDPASTDEPAAIWSGYEDYAAARRALADADLMIPLRWTHTIEEDPDATNSASDFSDEPEEFWGDFENFAAARRYLVESERGYHIPEEPEDPEEFCCGFESYSAGLQYLKEAGDPI